MSKTTKYNFFIELLQKIPTFKMYVIIKKRHLKKRYDKKSKIYFLEKCRFYNYLKLC